MYSVFKVKKVVYVLRRENCDEQGINYGIIFLFGICVMKFNIVAFVYEN